MLCGGGGGGGKFSHGHYNDVFCNTIQFTIIIFKSETRHQNNFDVMIFKYHHLYIQHHIINVFKESECINTNMDFSMI